ncbi:hypothetical protein Cylst_3410 [Cylindrospermum stagnale PCC 7417]|uniref:Uncharacterized protein n=1 Tax=Cylindrospermum stagnale PCC 7417 TaxID=56107 RepID=K9WYY9_9NOST|nr:hypothetical protein Cylst_3410 [Cylindrospermum stagnale PCC 7417]
MMEALNNSKFKIQNSTDTQGEANVCITQFSHQKKGCTTLVEGNLMFTFLHYFLTF